jgi:hypothetical protein
VTASELKKKEFSRTDDSGEMNPHAKLTGIVPVKNPQLNDSPSFSQSAASEASENRAQTPVVQNLADGADGYFRGFARFTVGTLSKVPEAALKLVKPKKEEV